MPKKSNFWGKFKPIAEVHVFFYTPYMTDFEVFDSLRSDTISGYAVIYFSNNFFEKLKHVYGHIYSSLKLCTIGKAKLLYELLL